MSHELFENLFADNFSEVELFNQKEIVHKLSHQHLVTRFWVVKSSNSNDLKVDWKNIHDFPVPRLVANFIEQYT